MRRTLVILCAIAGIAIARPAEATPVGGVSVSASVLYGINQAGDVRVDGFGVGLAAEAGVMLPGSLYLGASLEHFFGVTQEEALLSFPGIDIERSATITGVLGHVGYDWEVGGVVLRPSLGVGYALLDIERRSSSAGIETTTATSEAGLALSPAAEARIPVAGIVSGCVEFRYDAVVRPDEDDQTAFVIGVGVGIDL